MNNESKKVDIKIHIPEIILNDNPDVMKIYNPETESITYDIDSHIPQEFIDKLEELVPQFHGSDVVVFNPLLAAVNQLQAIKEVAYNADDFDASERLYIDNNKIIGSFNSSVTKVKKLMKDPQIAKNKMIDAIFNILETESKNTRGALEENFKPLLEERERKAAEKEAAQKAKELEAIAALSNTNSELQSKLDAQQKATALITVQNGLSSILTNIAIKVPQLNKEGLEQLKENLSSVIFNNYISPEIQNNFDHTELAVFQQTFRDNKAAALSNIQLAINAIDAQNSNISLANENAILQAQVPGPLEVNAMEMEVVAAEIVNQVENMDYLQGKDLTDGQKFNFITNANNRILTDYKTMIEMSKELEFNDSQFSQLRDKLTGEQFPKILEWLEKITAFCNKKQEIINQHFKQ